jgi:hypothetical protein
VIRKQLSNSSAAKQARYAEHRRQYTEQWHASEAKRQAATPRKILKPSVERSA